MRNRSQDRGAARLLLQFQRNEEVPKLVTLQEASRSKDVRNKLLMQARTNHHFQTRNVSSNQMSHLYDSLNEQRKEKQELRSVVRQLNFELQKLKEVNEGLIIRLKEVQSSYRNLRKDIEQQQEEERRRLKNSIYTDVEEYIKMTVERLTLNLKQERMTPALQNKLQRFLAELMEINSVSVEQITRKSRVEPLSSSKAQPPMLPGESRASIMGRYLTTDLKGRRQQLPSKQHYANIMQRLTGEASMSKSYAGAGVIYGSSSRDNRLKTVYATTPSKRKRIFD